MVDSTELGIAILREQARYWRTLGRHVLGAAFPFAGLALLTTISNLSRSSATDIYFRVELTTEAALGALAILATVIVALQIAVRSAGDSPDESTHAAIARQRILESVASVCGMAAIAVGFAALLGSDFSTEVVDLPRSFGALGASVLLAVLAADASCATENRLDPIVRAAQERLAAVRLERLLERHSTLRAPGLGSLLTESLVVLVALPLGLTWLSLQLWTPTGEWSAALRLTVLIALTLFYGVGVVLAVQARMRKKNVLALGVGAVVALVALTTIVIIAALGLRGGMTGIELSTWRDLIVHVLVSSVLVLLPLAACLLSCRSYAGRPGIGLEVILAASRRRLYALDGDAALARAPRPRHHRRARARRVWLAVLAVLAALAVLALVALAVVNPSL